LRGRQGGRPIQKGGGESVHLKERDGCRRKKKRGDVEKKEAGTCGFVGESVSLRPDLKKGERTKPMAARTSLQNNQTSIGLEGSMKGDMES